MKARATARGREICPLDVADWPDTVAEAHGQGRLQKWNPLLPVPAASRRTRGGRRGGVQGFICLRRYQDEGQDS
ncbi:hypothetical protein GUJ93_ZPchr0003g17129 [Zizania palustris]|uniref:Uncharacterized protein n=1 Tax=Zizania palustris TaxID=103762 RepID=A0A8J5S9Q2_ZIZPA|nr:hypothetical protein GUJ93_ZPchr0003g17129 [Zizania palustris]